MMLNKYVPNEGDEVTLTSKDSKSFAGPFRATVLDVVKLANDKTGLIVRTDPPVYFGPDPFAMRESEKFLLVARAAHQSLAEFPSGEPVSVHVADCRDWESVNRNSVDPKLLSVVAWGEVIRVPL